MSADTYKYSECFGTAGLEFKANYRQKKGDQICIASDDEIDENDDDAVTVVDIVDACELNEVAMSKKDCMVWAKIFLKATSEYLKENGKEDRVAAFKKESTEMFKFIISKHDEFQFYTGKAADLTAACSLAFSYQKNQEDEGPTFLFFQDALKI
jgi:hypothetical protein